MAGEIVCAVLHPRGEPERVDVTEVTQFNWRDSITTRNRAMAGV